MCEAGRWLANRNGRACLPEPLFRPGAEWGTPHRGRMDHEIRRIGSDAIVDEFTSSQSMGLAVAWTSCALPEGAVPADRNGDQKTKPLPLLCVVAFSNDNPNSALVYARHAFAENAPSAPRFTSFTAPPEPRSDFKIEFNFLNGNLMVPLGRPSTPTRW